MADEIVAYVSEAGVQLISPPPFQTVAQAGLGMANRGEAGTQAADTGAAPRPALRTPSGRPIRVVGSR